VGAVVGSEEVFLEQGGAEDSSIDSFESTKPLSFGVYQVPGSFEENEAGVLEMSAFFPGKPCDFLTADRIEGLVEESFDVEAIEDDFGGGRSHRVSHDLWYYCADNT
jgi:hypothetical protein